MKNNPVSRIAIFGFVNPVVNVLLSALLNGEPLFRWQYLGALVLVCVGIWLVNKAPAKGACPVMTGPIFDTHAHYSARAFLTRTALPCWTVLPGKGVVGVCEQATHSGDAPKVLELAHKYSWCGRRRHPSESLLAPEDCGEEGPAPLSRYTAATGPQRCVPLPLLRGPKVVAVGNADWITTGPCPSDAQLALFEAEIRLALELDKAHHRARPQAHADVSRPAEKIPKGIVHCYSSADDALWLSKQGLYFGFGGACLQGPSGPQKPSALPLERMRSGSGLPYASGTSNT